MTKMKNYRLSQLLIVSVLGIVATQRASASLVITPTFTSAFNTDFGANAAAAQTAWIAAASIYSSNFSDNIQINITVDAVTGTGTLGASSTPIFSIAYNNLYNAVLGDAKTPDDATATGAGGSLGGNGTAGSATDPIVGTHNWWVTRAQEKALGLLASDSTNDGTITFGTGFAYTFSGAVAGGTYDFQGVAAHEISEVMGRIGLCGSTVGGSAGYTLADAFSFSGAATRNTGNGANANFSLDDGNTLTKLWNNAALNGGDCRDWASGVNDAYNAFANTGVTEPVSVTDLRLMDALGYDRTLASVPEPATLGLFGVGLTLLGFVKMRSRSKRLR